MLGVAVLVYIGTMGERLPKKPQVAKFDAKLVLQLSESIRIHLNVTLQIS